MQEYIFQMAGVSGEALASLRLMRGLKVAEQDSTVWLRGIPFSEKLPNEIWELPAKHIYTLDKENNLFPIGTRVPVAKLSELVWIPIQQYVKVEAPVSAIRGEMKETVAVRLVPSSEMQAGQALLTEIAQWKAYADTAPLTRLKRLSFAASELNAVLLIGTPLPPLPGREYWMIEKMLLPCGYDFEIGLMRSLLPRKLNPDGDGFILFDTDGSWQKINADNFVTATRSAVRMTRIMNP